MKYPLKTQNLSTGLMSMKWRLNVTVDAKWAVFLMFLMYGLIQVLPAGHHSTILRKTTSLINGILMTSSARVTTRLEDGSTHSLEQVSFQWKELLITRSWCTDSFLMRMVRKWANPLEMLSSLKKLLKNTEQTFSDSIFYGLQNLGTILNSFGMNSIMSTRCSTSYGTFTYSQPLTWHWMTSTLKNAF